MPSTCKNSCITRSKAFSTRANSVIVAVYKYSLHANSALTAVGISAHAPFQGVNHGSVFGSKPRLARARRLASHCRSSHGQRLAQLYAGGPGRRGGERSARAGALRYPKRGAGVSPQQAHHGESGAGRLAQRLRAPGFAHRLGHFGGQRANRRRLPGRLRICRGVVALRRVAPGAWRLGHGAGPAHCPSQ